MAFTVEISVERTFDVDCTPDRAFEVVSDVPWSVSHFPELDALVDLGEESYRWEMQKIGIDRYYVQTIYACKYKSDPEKKTVKWTPVKGEGNAQVSGRWNIKELKDGGSRLKLTTKGEMEVPLPRLMKMAVAPMVRQKFEALIDQYLENLQETLESNKKRPKKKLVKKPQ